MPFCSDSAYNFPNRTSGSFPTGPDYAFCSGVSGSDYPVWYYMKVGTSGNIKLHLAQSTGPNGTGTGLDVDFCMWGPYDSLEGACQKIMAGDPPIQSAWSPNATEDLGIGVQGGSDYWCNRPNGQSTPPAAVAGQIYVVMIDNADGSAGFITFKQTNAGDPGAGSTDCAIVQPACEISDVTANPSACSSGKYSVSGTIDVSNPPNSGNLIVKDCHGNTVTVASAPFTANSYSYTISGLTADGSNCYVNAYFSDSTSCSKQATYTAPEPPQQPTISTTASTCASNGTAKVTNYNTSYTYSISPSGATIDGSGNITGSPGSYTVTVHDGACSNSKGFMLTPSLPKPTVSITGGTICNGSSFTINPTVSPTGGQYNWSTSQTTTSITVSPTVSPTTYTLNYTSNGCSDSDTAIVTILPTPVITLTPAQPSGCNLTDGSIQVSGSGTGTISWTGASSGSTSATLPATISNLGAGTYHVTFTTSAGCASSVVDATLANPGAPALNTIQDTISCGIPFTLNYSSITGTNLTGNQAFYSASGGNAADKIPDGTIFNTPTDTTIYVYDQNGSCSNQTFFHVVVNDSAKVNATGGAICMGGSLKLGAVGTPSGGSYQWNTGALSDSITVSPIADSVYTVTYTSATGCVGTDTAIVKVNPLPTANAGSDITVCAGETINLSGSATGGTPNYSYDWTGPNSYSATNTQNPSIPNASSSDVGSYTVKVTDANGCSDTNSVNVTVNPKPTANAGTDITVCAEETINFSASGGGTYSWTGPSSFSSAIQNPNIPNAASANGGTYQVIVAYSSGCSDTDSVNVTVNPKPTAVAGNDTMLCSGDTIHFAGTGGGSYSWTGPGFSTPATGANPSIPNVTISDAGQYTVVVTNGDNCSDTDKVQVTIHTTPTVSITGDSICSGNSYTINSTVTPTGGNYSWSTSQTDSSITVSPTTTTTYKLTYTTAQGCSAFDTAIVAVRTTPTITLDTITPSGCNLMDGGIIVQGSGVGSISWTGDSSGYISSVNLNDTIKGLGAGSYNVTFISSEGCPSAAVDATLLNPGAPALNTIQDTISCGIPFTLNYSSITGTNLTGNQAFYSAPGGNAADKIPDGTIFNAPTNTIIYAYDENGICSNQISFHVVVNDSAKVNVTGGAICTGGSLKLGAVGTPSGGNYQWNTGASSDSITASPTADSVYTVTYTSAAGCVGTDTAIVKVNPLPTITITSNSPLCQDDTLNLSATGGITYNWAGPNGFTSSQQDTAIADVLPNESGYYVVTVTDANGCVSKDSVDVTINPSFNDTLTEAICQGQTYTLPDNSIVDSTGMYVSSFTASTGCDSVIVTNLTVNPALTDTLTPIICQGQSYTLPDNTTVTSTGTYSDTLSTVEGCDSIVVVNLTVGAASSDTIDTPICQGQSLTLPNGTAVTTGGVYIDTLSSVSGCDSVIVTNVTVSPSPTTTAWADTNGVYPNDPIQFGDSSSNDVIGWYWNFGDGKNSTSQNPGHEFKNPGHYDVVLTVTNQYGCPDTAIVQIDIQQGVFIPNVFSPNGDGVNDKFYIKGGGFTEFNFRVYNRWGTLLFSSKAPQVAWDGNTNAGKKVSAGTYYFTLTAKTATKDYSTTGYVTLFR